MERLKYVVLIFLVFNSFHCLGQQLKLNTTIPFYLFQGDHIEFKVELSNLSDSEITGQVQLELTDSMNHQSVDGWLMNTFPNQYFTIATRKKETVTFPIQIPPQFNRVLMWRCTARTGSNTDTGINHKIYEEGILPVLTNRVENGESYSAVIKDTTVHQLLIKKLSTSTNNEAIENKLLQVEVACDPSMFALVGMPEIVHQDWTSTARLTQSFFAACLLASSNEATILNIDKQKLNAELRAILSVIKKRQLNNGAFPWIASGGKDLKTTIDFLTLVGQLKYLKVIPENIKNELDDIINNALKYADTQINKMIITHTFTISKWSDYFYMRSFYPEINNENIVSKKKEVLNLVNDAKLFINKTDQIRFHIYLLRSGYRKEVKRPEVKIEDHGLTNLTVEQLSILLELFHEIPVNNDKTAPIVKSIIQRKKENGWLDASSTLSAYYGLSLLQSSSKLCEPLIHLQIGSIHLYNTKEVEGKPISYFRKTIDGAFIKPDMGSVNVSVQNTQQLPNKKAYATVFWSYIDESENDKAQNTIRINKFILSKQGSINYPTVQLGDTLHVKLEVWSDKDYDHVELVDLPAAGLQPVIRDVNHVSMYNNHIYFYVNQLKRGKNELEYIALAKHTGAYNFGITELEVPGIHIKMKFANPHNITIE